MNDLSNNAGTQKGPYHSVNVSVEAEPRWESKLRREWQYAPHEVVVSLAENEGSHQHLRR